MVRDHGAVNEQALALVKKLHVTPQDNATSEALTKQAREKARELSKLRGHAFDRAYIQNEVAFHRTVNGALKTTLIPERTMPTQVAPEDRSHPVPGASEACRADCDEPAVTVRRFLSFDHCRLQ